MSSVGAFLQRPFVRFLGSRLLAARTPAQTRAVVEWGTRAMVPPLGIHTDSVVLGGIPALRSRRGNAATKTALLVLHGGGYVFGSARAYRALAARMAKLTGATAYTIDYRLAPENPYPAAIEDALAAYRAMLDARAHADIALVGDSAGGGLAVVAMQMARDLGLPLPSCAVLFSPWMDLSGSGESMRTNAASELLIRHPLPERMASWYAAGNDLADPGLSPLFGRYDGLPPLLVQVSKTEILYSDSERLAERARAAGVDVTLEVERDMWHVWQLMAPIVREARVSLASAATFVKRHLG